MKRYFLLFILVAAAALVGCKKTEPAPVTNVATPASSEAAIAPAGMSSPAIIAASPGAVPPAVKNAAPILPGKPGKDGKVASQPLPPAIWDRMTKPLSDEDIKKLPPETRDMILRAQGKIPPAPTPKK
jgi:hypothetical protein